MLVKYLLANYLNPRLDSFDKPYLYQKVIVFNRYEFLKLKFLLTCLLKSGCNHIH